MRKFKELRIKPFLLFHFPLPSSATFPSHQHSYACSPNICIPTHSYFPSAHLLIPSYSSSTPLTPQFPTSRAPGDVYQITQWGSHLLQFLIRSIRLRRQTISILADYIEDKLYASCFRVHSIYLVKLVVNFSTIDALWDERSECIPWHLLRWKVRAAL